jgi:hypothetical protein
MNFDDVALTILFYFICGKEHECKISMIFFLIKIMDQHMNAKCHMHFMKKYFYLGVLSSFDHVCTYLGLLKFSKHIGHV